MVSSDETQREEIPETAKFDEKTSSESPMFNNDAEDKFECSSREYTVDKPKLEKKLVI